MEILFKTTCSKFLKYIHNSIKGSCKPDSSKVRSLNNNYSIKIQYNNWMTQVEVEYDLHILLNYNVQHTVQYIFKHFGFIFIHLVIGHTHSVLIVLLFITEFVNKCLE